MNVAPVIYKCTQVVLYPDVLWDWGEDFEAKVFDVYAGCSWNGDDVLRHVTVNKTVALVEISSGELMRLHSTAHLILYGSAFCY
jgi:hypothetical protein